MGKFLTCFYLLTDGSIAYGLPTLAVTRRTKQSQHRLGEMEEVNKKICKIMRVPNEFVEIDPSELIINTTKK